VISNLQDKKVTMDCLKILALDRSEVVYKEADITEDITPLFYRGLRQKLMKGETIISSIEAQTRKGKSVLALHIMNFINQEILMGNFKNSILCSRKEIWEEAIKEKGINPIELLAPSKVDYNRVCNRKVLTGIATLCDEDSAMDNVGLNSSVEDKMTAYQLQVCAVSNVHTCFCSAGGNYYSKYSTLIIKIIDNDKKNKITKAKVYYNDVSSNEAPIMLGIITIDVSDILEKDWYRLYERQKLFAIDLQKSGISGGIRGCEFALTTLLLYKSLERMADIGGSKFDDLLSVKFDEVIRLTKGCHSILAKNEIMSRAKGLLNLKKLIKEKERSIKRVPKKKLTDNEKRALVDSLNEEIIFTKEELKKALEGQKSLIKIYLEYKSIGENSLKLEIEELCKNNNIKLNEVENVN